VWLLLVVLFLVASISAQSYPGKSNPSLANSISLSSPTQAGTALPELIRAGRLKDLRWPDFSDYRGEIAALYRNSNFHPIWIRAGRPTPQARQMIAILQQANNDGLRAEDYDAARWTERLARLNSRHAPSDETRFDLALTVCAMRYVSGLRTGRINPQHFHFALNPKEVDLSRFIETQLAGGKNLPVAIASLAPPLPGYGRLRNALVNYIKLAKEDDGEKLPVPTSRLVSGTPYAGVPRLARLLRRLGDLPPSAEVPADPPIYDAPLVEAVKQFQKRHGLPSDGILDQATIDQLNVPLSDRVEQIRLALERYRWLRYDFSQAPIIINIPAFRLYALNGQGKTGLEMTVDVGQEYSSTRTPVLESNIEYLVFRPYWDVPFDIQRDEIVPEAEQYSDYLSGFEFEVISPDGRAISNENVTPKILAQIRSGHLRVRQKPGPANALGLVKFVFPNRYSVYLHDTPSWTNYFADPNRNISHGCIHVKEPAELAAWVLRDKPEWTLEKVLHAMKEGPDNFRVNLTKPVPVLIVYLTAVAREDGDIYFYPDIYGYDAELRQALAKGYPYP
jgi:murein L,D-transpeptidase YcbB/YkuD